MTNFTIETAAWGHDFAEMHVTPEQFDALAANFDLVSTVAGIDEGSIDTLEDGEGGHFRTTDLDFGGITLTLYTPA